MEEKELQFPVVVKGCLARAHLARNAEEAQGFARQLISTWGAPVILQEWVQGEEYSAAIFADRQSILKAACVIRKMGMSDQGKTWMAVTVEANPFLRLVDSFVRKLGWTGPAEVEIIKRENGELVVFEVNPRFPAWLPLCRHAGADMVDTALRIAMGKEEREMKIGKAGSCFARNYHSSVFSMQDMGSFYSQGELEFRSSR